MYFSGTAFIHWVPFTISFVCIRSGPTTPLHCIGSRPTTLRLFLRGEEVLRFSVPTLVLCTVSYIFLWYYVLYMCTIWLCLVLGTYYGYYQSPTLHSQTLYKEVLEGFTPRQHTSNLLVHFSSRSVYFLLFLFLYFSSMLRSYVMKLALMRHLFSWRGCAFTRYGARAPRTSSTCVESSCWTRVHSACTRACPLVPLLYLRRGFVSVR